MIFTGLLDLPWWGYVVFTLVMTHITIAAVTIYLHRHQAHRAVIQTLVQGSDREHLSVHAYVGPGGPGQASGPPRIVGTTPLARDEVAQRRLWETSEETVGLSWP